MLFSSFDWINTKPDCLKDFTFVFWLRDPYYQLLSLYKKTSDLSVLENLTDYNKLYDLYTTLKSTYKVYIFDCDKLKDKNI